MEGKGRKEKRQGKRERKVNRGEWEEGKGRKEGTVKCCPSRMKFLDLPLCEGQTIWPQNPVQKDL